MSLSEAPSIKITSTTPRDISDEILGGTISFCNETGYKQSPLILTFLWAGFLLSTKTQLGNTELVEKVLNCYTYSLGAFFPTLTVDATLKNQIAEMLRHYWDHLNQDFNDLNNETEVSEFLQIATKLNDQDDVVSSYLLIKDPLEPFIKVSSILHSSIYRILHQINNELAIQYRSIVQRPSPHQQATATRHVHEIKPHHTTNKTDAHHTTSNTTPRNKILHWTTIFILVIAAVMVITAAITIVNDSSSSNPLEQNYDLTEIPEPISGTVLSGQVIENESKLTIKASGGSSCVVKLKTYSGLTRLSFYVRAGDTVTIGVPAEKLYVYFASGDTWYGEKHLFGSKTAYSMDNELTDFSRGTYEYTLYPVNNGNFSETPIDPEDF